MDSAILAQHFSKCNATISLFKLQINELQNILKQIEKQTAKELKLNQQINKLNKNEKNEKKEKKEKRIILSGIQTPRLLSDQLCAFLNIERGSQMSRPNVTKLLNKYIKEHALYNKENKQLDPDETLAKLICPFTDEFKLTHFTIQKCMTQHFI
tara:strand:+ start:469 stop:930 length:462 start_codon:yes stop_codon:yes gene_type:complete